MASESSGLILKSFFFPTQIRGSAGRGLEVPFFELFFFFVGFFFFFFFFGRGGGGGKRGKKRIE